MKILLSLFLLCSLAAQAQVQNARAICTPNPEVEYALTRLNIGGGAPVESSLEARKRILAELLQQYPDDLFVHMMSRTTFFSTAGELQLRDQYQALAQKHPDSLMFKYLYARALVDIDTPKAIELLKQVETADPGFAWTYIEFATIHLHGKYIDKQQVRSELDKFFGICPNSLDYSAWHLLLENGSPEMLARYTPALRERLMTETDRKNLRTWKTVWNLEFKATPVAQYPQLRKQVEIDTVRLEQIPGEPDARWLAFLKSGYEQAGDEESAKRIEHELLAKYPGSQQAEQIISEHWWKEHPSPDPGEPDSKKQAYYRVSLQAEDELLKTRPDDSYLLLDRFSTLSQIDDTTDEQLTNAADGLLSAMRKYPNWQSHPPVDFQIADVFLKRNMHPERVPTLVEEGSRIHGETDWAADWETDEAKAEDQREHLRLETRAAELLTRAARELKKPEIARAAVTELNKLTPDKSEDQSAVWAVKAAFAEVEGRKLDALLMYQAAIKSRPPLANPKGKDELADNEERLWRELGGSAASRNLWEKKIKVAELTSEGGWEKPTQAMLAWELSDLQGRTWKMMSLNGKRILINVWATWCGPCRSELPEFQKIYDQVKERPDITALSFNVDSEIGKVEPFIKQEKYTFPVLLAYDYVNDLLPELVIPQAWVVDTDGKWLWERVGFDFERGRWREDVLAKIGQQ
jgi:thiol-disulfide isomerase/thioredoxin